MKKPDTRKKVDRKPSLSSSSSRFAVDSDDNIMDTVNTIATTMALDPFSSPPSDTSYSYDSGSSSSCDSPSSPCD